MDRNRTAAEQPQDETAADDVQGFGPRSDKTAHPTIHVGTLVPSLPGPLHLGGGDPDDEDTEEVPRVRRAGR